MKIAHCWYSGDDGRAVSDLLFYSIAHLTLADASMLAYMSPFFSIVLSLLVLRERVNATMAFWLVMVIIGAIILIRPWNFSTYTLASLVG